jgi:hypothetical protein
MDRWLSVIYCDDIRFEMGNKHSFMGVYGPLLFVPQVPVILPKLCVAITAFTMREHPFRRLIFRVLRDKDVLIESPFDAAQLEDAAAKKEDAFPLSMAGVYITLAPFPIEAETVLRVRAETENGELKAVGLRIAVNPDLFPATA